MNSSVIAHLVRANIHAQFVARGLKTPAAYAKTKAHATDAIKLFHAKLKEHKRGKGFDAAAAMKLAMNDVTAWARKAATAPAVVPKTSPGSEARPKRRS